MLIMLSLIEQMALNKLLSEREKAMKAPFGLEKQVSSPENANNNLSLFKTSIPRKLHVAENQKAIFQTKKNMLC